MSRLFRSPDRAPTNLPGPKVFLAGSIEMGRAELWQPRVSRTFLEAGVSVFDPRRDDWDASWTQDPAPGTPFETQVSWELDHIEMADLTFFRFCEGTASIVSMLETGLVLASGKPVVIQADPGYMRRGNLVITARRFGVEVFSTERDAVNAALDMLRKRS